MGLPLTVCTLTERQALLILTASPPLVLSSEGGLAVAGPPVCHQCRMPREDPGLQNATAEKRLRAASVAVERPQAIRPMLDSDKADVRGLDEIRSSLSASLVLQLCREKPWEKLTLTASRSFGASSSLLDGHRRS